MHNRFLNFVKWCRCSWLGKLRILNFELPLLKLNLGPTLEWLSKLNSVTIKTLEWGSFNFQFFWNLYVPNSPRRDLFRRRFSDVTFFYFLSPSLVSFCFLVKSEKIEDLFFSLYCLSKVSNGKGSRVQKYSTLNSISDDIFIYRISWIVSMIMFV